MLELRELLTLNLISLLDSLLQALKVSTHVSLLRMFMSNVIAGDLLNWLFFWEHFWAVFSRIVDETFLRRDHQSIRGPASALIVMREDSCIRGESIYQLFWVIISIK